MNIKQHSGQIAKKVKTASLEIANLNSETKNKFLLAVAKNIKNHLAEIMQANQIDVRAAQANNMDQAKLDRLILDEKRINNLADAIIDIANLPDPLNKISYDISRDNGLHIRRISVPIGVIMAIYESRPNVTSDVAALCFKSGNAVILRSGSESYHSSKKIAEIYQQSLRQFNINQDAIYYVDSTNRDYVKYLLKCANEVDVVIPRGGKNLIKAIMKSTKIPVFKHLDGNCHTYIESHANLEKALKITVNAKMRRVGVCGATESLLVDKKIAEEFLPKVIAALQDLGCEVRGDALTQKIAHKNSLKISQATAKDFATEYLDKIIAVKVVKNIDEAIKHINNYGSSHTESIITEDRHMANKFFKEINSAIVLHNASTQFADGGEFGLGAEVGISTGKLHARGPVGLEQLVIYKYIVNADCAVRG